MLNYFYNVAFEATFERTNLVIADGQGVLEGFIVGKHIGEFAGITATNKDFRAPTCISYDVVNGKLKRARIYFSVASLMAQVGAMGS
jgi:predicted ester cyclase